MTGKGGNFYKAFAPGSSSMVEEATRQDHQPYEEEGIVRAGGEANLTSEDERPSTIFLSLGASQNPGASLVNRPWGAI
mgnify:CR=1 FL=1